VKLSAVSKQTALHGTKADNNTLWKSKLANTSKYLKYINLLSSDTKIITRALVAVVVITTIIVVMIQADVLT
jgi:hypothetical protein